MLDRRGARAKSYFFSTVSHDIRTPLNAIIGYSEMLRAGFQTEEERVQAVDSILVSGRTLLALVNDVLDLSKLESGRMEIIPEPTDCPRLLREMADAFSASSGNQLLELRSTSRCFRRSSESWVSPRPFRQWTGARLLTFLSRRTAVPSTWF